MNKSKISEIVNSRLQMAKERANEGKSTDLYDSRFDDPQNPHRRTIIRYRYDGTIIEMSV